MKNLWLPDKRFIRQLHKRETSQNIRNGRKKGAHEGDCTSLFFCYQKPCGYKSRKTCLCNKVARNEVWLSWLAICFSFNFKIRGMVGKISSKRTFYHFTNLNFRESLGGNLRWEESVWIFRLFLSKSWMRSSLGIKGGSFIWVHTVSLDNVSKWGLDIYLLCKYLKIQRKRF